MTNRKQTRVLQTLLLASLGLTSSSILGYHLLDWHWISTVAMIYASLIPIQIVVLAWILLRQRQPGSSNSTQP